MRNILAPVKNVLAVKSAFGELEGRFLSLPGMAALTGPTGFGKTFTVGKTIVQVNGIYVRMLSISTPRSMLMDIAQELGLHRSRWTQEALFRECAREMVQQRRSLWVDEVNYVSGSDKMLHLFRDLHDVTTQPVVLISEENLRATLKRVPQVLRRITAWVEFRPLDRDDLVTLAESVCEVKVAPDLIEYILEIGGGNMRDSTTALAKIERLAQAKQLKSITRTDVGRERLTYGAR